MLQSPCTTSNRPAFPAKPTWRTIRELAAHTSSALSACSRGRSHLHLEVFGRTASRRVARKKVLALCAYASYPIREAPTSKTKLQVSSDHQRCSSNSISNYTLKKTLKKRHSSDTQEREGAQIRTTITPSGPSRKQDGKTQVTTQA